MVNITLNFSSFFLLINYGNHAEENPLEVCRAGTTTFLYIFCNSANWTNLTRERVVLYVWGGGYGEESQNGDGEYYVIVLFIY